MVAANGDVGLREAVGVYIHVRTYVARARASSRHQPPRARRRRFLYMSFDDTGPAVRGCDAEPEWQRGGCTSQSGRGLVY